MRLARTLKPLPPSEEYKPQEMLKKKEPAGELILN